MPPWHSTTPTTSRLKRFVNTCVDNFADRAEVVSHDESSTGPARGAFLGERRRTLSRIVGGENAFDQAALQIPHVVDRPGRRFRHDPLRHGYGQRSVGRDRLGERQRGNNRLAAGRQSIDQPPMVSLLE